VARQHLTEPTGYYGFWRGIKKPTLSICDHLTTCSASEPPHITLAAIRLRSVARWHWPTDPARVQLWERQQQLSRLCARPITENTRLLPAPVGNPIKVVDQAAPLAQSRPLPFGQSNANPDCPWFGGATPPRLAMTQTHTVEQVRQGLQCCPIQETTSAHRVQPSGIQTIPVGCPPRKRALDPLTSLRHPNPALRESP